MLGGLAMPDDLEGKRLGRYLLRYGVARGGMATVYLAQLAGPGGFEKWVAIKVIHPHLAGDRRFRDMFFDEARIAANINHPSVCSVIDFGEDRGLAYLVLEYMHGQSLSAVARRAWRGDGMPIWLAARVVADAARGLHAAHELRVEGQHLEVVHRDVSPQNVFVLYDGFSKVLDFGVARARGRVASTVTGEVKGKFAYMAPEQLRDEEIDRRTDVWALGVVFWEILTGSRLFRGESQAATVLNVLKDPIPMPSELRDGVPADVEVVVAAALQRDPSRRTATAAEMADSLEDYLHSLGSPAGVTQVGQWMRSRFADKLATRNALLRAETLPIEEVSVVDLESDVSSFSRRLDAQETRTVEPRLSAYDGLPSVDVELPASDADPSSVDAGETRALALPTTVTSKRLFGLTALAIAGLLAGVLSWAPWEHGDLVAKLPKTEPAAAGALGAVPTVTGPVQPADAPELDPDAGRQEPPEEAASAELPARAGRPRRPRPQRAAVPGRLSLLAIPAAEVRLGGRTLGRTPLANVELPAGRHRLLLTPIDGGPAQQVAIVVRAGELTRRTVRLAR